VISQALTRKPEPIEWEEPPEQPVPAASQVPPEQPALLPH
jgi:hypothetical protein